MEMKIMGMGNISVPVQLSIKYSMREPICDDN